MKKTNCLSCNLPTQERLHYFTGQFLTQRDFQDEQNYFIGKHRQHNRYLHGYGTVCGLKVVQHSIADCRDRFVILEPGFALDCCGREILVKEPIYIDVIKYFAVQNIDLNSIKPEDGNHLLLSLCYNECKTEFVSALYSECGCDEMGSDANRIYEGVEVELQLVQELPNSPHSEPVGVSLNWITTLNLSQASRLAFDGKHLYVLTAAEPSQILVYEADNYVLLRSIDVGARGADLVVSRDGKYLYIIRDKAAIDPADNYFLQVLNVENLGTPPPTVNTLPLGNRPIDLNNPPQVLVAAADGKVYTLDPKTKKIIVWKTSINTSGVDPNLPVGDANSPKYAEIDTGDEPRAIALSPDGTWLFVADGIANEVKAFKIETLNQPPASQIIHTISLGESPRLLSVTGDSSRVYLVTGNKKVRAFHIQKIPQLFPEISTSGGIDLGLEEPVAMTASRSGRWLYLLLKDSSNSPPKGIIKVVDGGKLETDPSHAVSEPISVVTNPQDIILDAEKGRLYAAGQGAETPPPYGGVSVLEVTEKSCSEIVWRALDDCPDCPEDTCVPLAVVENYLKNYQNNDKAITDAKIENQKFRPLVPSTETLRQLVMCALESHATQSNLSNLEDLETLKKRLEELAAELATLKSRIDAVEVNISSIERIVEEFSAEINILRGRVDALEERTAYLENKTGNLEAELTQIVALSWRHNEGNNPIIRVTRLNNQKAPALAIAFGSTVVVDNRIDIILKPINVSQIDDEHVFQVLIQELRRNQTFCRCNIRGQIIPVNFEVEKETDSNGNVVAIQIQPETVKESETSEAPGVAFLLNESLIKETNELWIQFRGDFVLDLTERAIDAEFIRAQLPTGNRRRLNPWGIQGGLFESWFWIGDRPKSENA